ncbi:hypothetical protein L3Q82_017274, partial [Scortum barcoo]
MDPADADTVRSALTAQGTKLQHQETKLNTIAAGVQQLTDRQAELQMEVTTQVNRLTAQLQLVVTRLEGLAPPTPAKPAPAQPSAPSAPTSASPRLALFAWPHQRNSRESPVSAAHSWYSVISTSRTTQLPLPLGAGTGRVYGVSSDGQSGSLGHGRVGLEGRRCARINRRVVDYAIEFRTLAADSGWDDVAIRDAFVTGLTEEIKDHLAPMELPGNFESLVDMATRIDNRLHERERERRQGDRRSSEGWGALRHHVTMSPHAQCQQRTDEQIPNPSDYPDISKVPPCYHDLKEVFNKAKAMSLPPHREWDCAIDLLPGAPIPKACCCIPSPALRGRPWNNILKRRCGPASYAPHHHQPEPGSSLWRLATDNRIHPCAFLSRKLTSAERNYDMGNKELLVDKVALEEWRNWLEGEGQPFIVLTDHKNLQYLKSAKRLNSRQA